MFTLKAQAEKTKLEEVIEEALTQLSPYDDDYIKHVEALERLYKMKEADSPRRVSPDTLAQIGGSLAGIALILSYEHLHPITSKALGFLPKIR